MANQISTLLTLLEWCQIIGVNPYWAQQIGDDVPERGSVNVQGCEHVLFEQSWQAYEFLSRYEILEAIAQAEQLFADICGFWPAPKYVVSEPHQYPHNYDRQFPIRYGMRAASGQFKSIQTKYGHIQVIGIESLTLVGDFATVLSDETGSGIDDTFTISAVVPAGTTAASIAAFFVSADRAGLSLEASEIKPLTVSVSGVNATITGHVSLLVLPELQLKVAPDTLSALDATIYASDVTIYTRATDISNNGTLIWNNIYPCEAPPCQAEIATACFGIRDFETGFLYALPAEWDSTLDQFNRTYPCCVGRDPDRVSVNYLAGIPRQGNGRMQHAYAVAIAKLATGLLSARTCGCNRADQRLLYYKSLPVDNSGNLLVPRALMEKAGEMLGSMSRGAVESWSFIEKHQQWSSVNLG